MCKTGLQLRQSCSGQRGMLSYATAAKGLCQGPMMRAFRRQWTLNELNYECNTPQGQALANHGLGGDGCHFCDLRLVKRWDRPCKSGV
jgi:hypothetical protein